MHSHRRERYACFRWFLYFSCMNSFIISTCVLFAYTSVHTFEEACIVYPTSNKMNWNERKKNPNNDKNKNINKWFSLLGTLFPYSIRYFFIIPFANTKIYLEAKEETPKICKQCSMHAKPSAKCLHTLREPNGKKCATHSVCMHEYRIIMIIK